MLRQAAQLQVDINGIYKALMAITQMCRVSARLLLYAMGQ